MKFVIGAILLLIALFIIGLIWRKKVYDEVDRLEGWKMDIMNRRVTEELSKVKSLNLSGETQEKFEEWRERWDQILTKELPELEEDLFDAEEAADRYRMKRVKVVLGKTEKKLVAIEEDIKAMLQELEDLLDSEKQSRLEIESMEPDLKELTKVLIQNRHQYGKAVRVFEQRVEDLKQQLEGYEQLANKGNYIEANALVRTIRQETTKLQEDVQYFPERYKLVRTELPEQLAELKNGVEDMKAEGYRISQFDLLPEIHSFERSLEEMMSQLEMGDQTGVEESLQEIETRIQEMYQLLESEAIAHHYVEKQFVPLKVQLDELGHVLAETERELVEIQKTYQVEQEDIEAHRSLMNWFSQMHKRVTSLEFRREDGETSYASLRDDLEEAQRQLKELEEQHSYFHERVQNLRKDEREAKQKLTKMENLLLDTHRRLKRSNIPGIPTSVYDDMKAASEKVDEVFRGMEMHPLDMVVVNEMLEEASGMIEQLNEDAEKVMETAHLAERVIQYGNRYRSKYPILAAKLLESEEKFRSCHYEEALKLASEAIKEVDPAALSKIDKEEEVLL
ncbi:septation ring formation regulator EzrA [Halobacillus karajensis]|uniref:Septation ring formation regulator EzrA n=1 Tax=Halobacillus karajensis TaxID=195088 RepID=A0A024P8M2_9BACI|nr:septation ring formation regulator EzrA [Halobacillus karajensis]CDQ18313.1 Septation ring formation regulator EzrA [Halobacillus karajensis]CDQ24667.1 Septation ring formation regulator EzrA [Halobacillus karajensis]CDQ29087.1 Septation ring formation regulator EzrA [Halobacillus karajensis]